MSGPISDSYDPEFGTGENADLVAEAVRDLRDRVSDAIGDQRLQPILDVVRGGPGELVFFEVQDERDARILRFALNRALESL